MRANGHDAASRPVSEAGSQGMPNGHAPDAAAAALQKEAESSTQPSPAGAEAAEGADTPAEAPTAPLMQVRPCKERLAQMVQV